MKRYFKVNDYYYITDLTDKSSDKVKLEIRRQGLEYFNIFVYKIEEISKKDYYKWYNNHDTITYKI